jgi:thiamine monophosphate kinase
LGRLRRHLGCSLTEIGEIRPGRGVSVESPGGRVAVWRGGGYDHFRER